MKRFNKQKWDEELEDAEYYQLPPMGICDVFAISDNGMQYRAQHFNIKKYVHQREAALIEAIVDKLKDPTSVICLAIFAFMDFWL